ncbi:MAG: pilus assembly protein PilM [Candidatus Omnitrophota bacterium]
MPREITTVVEFTDTHLKVCQSKDTPSGKIIAQLLFENLNVASDADLAKSLSVLIARLKLPPGKVIGVLPRSQATMRFLRLPSQDPVEIENMIGLQIAKHTPYSKEDVVVDYLLAGKDDEGHSLVALVIAHKDAVNRYVNIFKTAKLNLNQLTLSSQGICDLYLYYQGKLKMALKKETVLILEVDKASTEACFYFENNLLYSRPLQIGSSQIIEEQTASLLEELRLTISSFNKENPGSAPKRLVLAGSIPNIDSLSKKLETELSLEAEIINPRLELPIEKNISLPLSWTSGEVSAGAVLGFALQKAAKPLNLLPRRIIAEHRQEKERKEMVSSLVLLGVIFGMLVTGFFIKVSKQARYLDALVRSMEENREKVKTIEAMSKRMAVIREIVSPAVSAVEIIYDIYAVFPTDMTLSSLEYDETGNVVLEGSATLMSRVFDLQGRLEQAAHFKDVEVKFVSKRNTPAGEVCDFKITCQVDRKAKF